MVSKVKEQNKIINIEQDLNEISKLIWNYLDEKYIGVIKHRVDGYRSECESHLCKEAQLIQAVMPFLPEEKKLLQLIVDAIVYNEIIEKTFIDHKELTRLYRDDNKEKEQIKKLVYKLIMMKLLMTLDQMSIDK